MDESSHAPAGLTADDACLVPARYPQHAPQDDDLVALLANTRTVAVVGMSPRPDRTSFGVASWLSENSHFDLFWVNPNAVGEEALGRPFYASLADLPVVPDLVDVFRRPDALSSAATDAVAVGARTLWFQLGIINEEAASEARAAGLAAVQNRCLKVEYRRLADRIAERLASL